MIQAGTMTTGSGRTRSVAGAYWMISARRVRFTMSPGVTATVSPNLECFQASGRCADIRRLVRSAIQFG
jgi:hypothetical protein